ncbi:MAG: hypothetical protein OXI87_14370 [Albidovulum sp.]|nr:hypothetical protein [Albidovulum sp.]MDE0532591.1 hypothetical protein [Albidovulum sp.]
MEDVFDARCKVCADDEVPVCMDETSRQQTLEVAPPIEARPCRPEIRDFEYVRNGVSCPRARQPGHARNGLSLRGALPGGGLSDQIPDQHRIRARARQLAGHG